MNKEGITYSSYLQYVEENLPLSWRKVSQKHNVEKQLIEAIAKYCYEHLLKGCELYYHLHENELICSADFSRESQGIRLVDGFKLRSQYVRKQWLYRNIL